MTRLMKTIYVIDDMPEMLETLKTALELSNYEVRAFSSGREAIQALGEKVPDVVVTDLDLQASISGFDLIGQVRHRFPKLPVIVTSGCAVLPESILQLGVAAFCPKPLDMNLLLSAVREAVTQCKPG
tara:strand:+ start:4347 stop:4727 length:381 start_codon:yes stop_codon:yes gene_type:complete